MAGILKMIVGGGMIAGGVLLDVYAGGAGGLGNMLIAAGAGQVMSGVGSMIQGDPIKGFATTTRNPIAPWRVCYGRVRTGGTLVYLHTWGDQDQMLDMVIVLAAHKCEAVDVVLFDQQRVQIDTSAIPTGAKAGYPISTPAAGSGTSFTPVQQTVNISSIVREGSVVTVTLPVNIPYLMAGDQIEIRNVPGDLTLNGVFQVAEVKSQVPGTPGSIVFTYLCGGEPTTITSAGQARTRWPDYGRNVYVEYMLGDQALGQTFVGMTAGTPWQGTGKLCTPASPQNAGGTPEPNPWTNYCSLQGKTAVFIRMRYEEKYFRSGLPQISFLIRGKNDIYDPRTDTSGYTENAALCIADFLAHETWGFKAAYGTEIPAEDLDPNTGADLGTGLKAAAEACDQQIDVAKGGHEPRYTCNGQFELTMRRGEILQNLLTSCAGRLTYVGGQFRIFPGIWMGSSPTAVDLTNIAAGPFTWRPKSSIRDLFNGVKGTFIAPDNKWQSADFPYYAQDGQHGYHGSEAYGGDINLDDDGGERRWLELNLPFTISSSTAQRIAKIELLRRRHGGTGTFQLSMAGYRFAPLDVISATVPFLAFAGQVLEVQATRFRMNEQEGGIALGVDIDVQETDSAIYAWSTEEELSPQGYVQSKYPQGQAVETVPWPWSPGYVAPLAGDAIHPEGPTGPANFGLQSAIGYNAQGAAYVALTIKGTPPVNALDEDISKPQFSCISSDAGGNLPEGTYVIGLAARDSSDPDYGITDYLTLAVVHVPGSGSGSIAVTVNWGSGNDGGNLYVGEWSEAGYVFHWNQTLTSGQESATIAALDKSKAGGPDPMFSRFRVSWLQEWHGGPWANVVSVVTANTLTFGGAGMTEDQWQGYTLSLLAKKQINVDVPILNMPVQSSTASSEAGTFTLTIGPNSAGDQLPDLRTLLEPGDVVLMRFHATFTATSFADPNIANGYYPDGATSPEVGNIAVVLSGADAGDVQTISSVSQDGAGKYTIFNLAAPWKVTPATGDIVVVCAPGTPPDWLSAPFSVRNASLCAGAPAASVNVGNALGQTLLVTVHTEDANGNRGAVALAPRREVYIYGAGEADTLITAEYWVTLDDQNLEVDTTPGPIPVHLPSIAVTRTKPLTISKVSDDANYVELLPDGDETVGDQLSLRLLQKGDSYTIKPGR